MTLLKRIITSWLVVGLVLFLVSGNLLAATFYVASTGADTAAGSQAQPWKTLQQAADKVGATRTELVRFSHYQRSCKSTSRLLTTGPIALRR